MQSPAMLPAVVAIEAHTSRPVELPGRLVEAALEALVAGTTILTIAKFREFKPSTANGYDSDAQPKSEVERLEKALDELRQALA